MNIKRNWKKLAFFFPFFFLIIFFLLVPFLRMVGQSFRTSSGGFGLERYLEIFSKLAYITAIKNSLWISVSATVIGIVIDFFLALALSKTSEKSKNWYLSVLNLTSTFSGLPLTLSFITILGTAGVLVLIGQQLGIGWLADYNLYSLKGMYVIYVYFQIPMGTLLLLPAFGEIRKEWREAAILMNCNAARFWIRIGIPVMMPAIMGTTSMLFANALTAYTTPYLLINNSIPLLPVKITDMFVGDVRQRPELGSALSMVMLGFMLIVLAVTNLVKKKFEKGRK